LLTRHQNSKQHKDAAKEILEKKKKKVLIKKSSYSSDPPLESIIRNIWWLAIENIALVKAENLHTLTSSHGVDISQAYWSSSATTEILECISFVYEEILLNEIKGADFISIMIDESEDSALEEVLLIYARYVVNYEVKEKLISVHYLEERDANAITAILKEDLAKKGIFSKVVSMATDGAKVMVAKNGIVNKIREEVGGFLIGYHCVCHCLALGTSELQKQYEDIHHIYKIIYDISDLFSSSTKRKKIFEKAQNQLERERLYMVKPYKIRWLVFGLALERFISEYQVVIVGLQELREEATNP